MILRMNKKSEKIVNNVRMFGQFLLWSRLNLARTRAGSSKPSGVP